MMVKQNVEICDVCKKQIAKHKCDTCGKSMCQSHTRGLLDFYNTSIFPYDHIIGNVINKNSKSLFLMCNNCTNARPGAAKKINNRLISAACKYYEELNLRIDEGCLEAMRKEMDKIKPEWRPKRLKKVRPLRKLKKTPEVENDL